jgi:hypothetical protein
MSLLSSSLVVAWLPSSSNMYSSASLFHGSCSRSLATSTFKLRQLTFSTSNENKGQSQNHINFTTDDLPPIRLGVKDHEVQDHRFFIATVS